jgi:hypothetical protein
MTPRSFSFRFRSLAACVLVVMLAAGAAGCSDTVDPFLDVDRDYTLFGFLDTDVDRQLIRVIPLRRRVEIPEAAPLDARVTLTDLTTGGTIALRDSLVTLTDTLTRVTQPGNIFIADFRPEHGHTYELVVEGPDGRRSSACTTVPDVQQAIVGAERFTTGVISAVTQDVIWPDVQRKPFRVEMWYRFRPNSASGAFRDVVVNYGTDKGEVTPPGWRVTANYTRDLQDALETLALPSVPALYAVGMKLSYVSEDWVPPGGEFDFDALIQPGTFSNVEGGFGFFGSVAQLDVQWGLSERALTQLQIPSPVQ